VIRELAENANTYQVLGPGEERIVDPRFVIWIGAGVDDPHWTVVQRLRLAAGEVDAAVAEIRALVRSRGRTSCTWEVADSATPSDLVERLLALGCVPDGEPVAVGMVLRRPPVGVETADVVARRVETVAEAAEAARIAAVAFGMPAAAARETVEQARVDFARHGVDGATYVALSAGRVVARATAAFTEHGVLLFGGATLPEARGLGAYRALVRARWEDAVERGTPLLVTHAGAMSQPILARLGFEPVSRIEILVDERV
jgi:hypothetical protein